MTTRILYIAILTLPLWPLALETVWIIQYWTAPEHPRMRWASELPPLDFANAPEN